MKIVRQEPDKDVLQTKKATLKANMSNPEGRLPGLRRHGDVCDSHLSKKPIMKPPVISGP